MPTDSLDPRDDLTREETDRLMEAAGPSGMLTPGGPEGWRRCVGCGQLPCCCPQPADPAKDLFLWLGFQPSDDNDCHRFSESPLTHIASVLRDATLQGRQDGLEEAARVADGGAGIDSATSASGEADNIARAIRALKVTAVTPIPEAADRKKGGKK